MIPIPALPTDNLYKFLFVFGVILIISTGYFSSQNLNYKKNELIELDSLTNKWKIMVSELNVKASYSKFQDSVDIFLNKAKQLRKEYDLKKTHTRSEMNIFNFKIENINNILKEKKSTWGVEEDKKIKTVDNFGKLIENVQSKQKIQEIGDNSNLVVIIIGFTIGVVFSVTGGFLWYIKSQKLQDSILELQLKQMESELKSNNKIKGRQHHEPITTRRI